MPLLYHISDYANIDNVDPGGLLFLTPESAWA
jgi:hypothetical protein